MYKDSKCMCIAIVLVILNLLFGDILVAVVTWEAQWPHG